MDSKNCYTKEALMCEIMKYEFTADELTLFLDTHPCDSKALEMRTAIIEKLCKFKNLYNSNYGPITADSVRNTDNWTWINSPWPWEN